MSITCGHRRNRERGVRHGVEHSNDLTDGVVTRRDGYLFTIGVRDHIVEVDWVWPEKDIHGSDVRIPMLVGVDPEECAISR